MTPDLPATLARLEAWLAAHAPALHAQLAPGSTDAELDELETQIGQKLPEAYRALYRAHAYWGHAFGLDHIPFEGVYAGEWAVWHELEADFQRTEGHISHPAGAIRAQYINLGWIPFLRDWGGNSVGVDLNPGPQEKVGQAITFGRDERAKYVLADSLDAFLTEYLARLEAGRVRLYQHEPDEPDTLRLYLLDEDCKGDDSYRRLADFYPGFGAAPARRSR